MRVNLTYQHWSNEIFITFNLIHKDEESFAFGNGATEEEARNNMTDWFNRESEAHAKTYKVTKEKPYIHLIKQNKDGAKLKTKEPINVVDAFRDIGPAPAESVTSTSFDF